MSFQISKVLVWSAELDDRPGAAAEKLRQLAGVKADLQFVMGRRSPENPGRGLLTVAPIRGRQQEEAAKSAGFVESTDLVAVRVEGTNKPGLGSQITEALSDAEVNLAGLNAVVTGKKFAAFVAFDSSGDAEKGLKILRRIG